LGAAEGVCGEIGVTSPLGVREEYERAVREGRAALGEQAFAAAWAEGRAMPLEAAIRSALAAGGAEGGAPGIHEVGGRSVGRVPPEGRVVGPDPGADS
jgi:hypothetical protein